MKLTPSESRILRRELAEVDSLFQKKLITIGPGRRVKLTQEGQAWIAEYKEHLSAARASAGKAGAKVRARTLTRAERVRIARIGSRAAQKTHRHTR